MRDRGQEQVCAQSVEPAMPGRGLMRHYPDGWVISRGWEAGVKAPRPRYAAREARPRHRQGLGYSQAIRECHLSLENKPNSLLPVNELHTGCGFCRSARRLAMTTFIASGFDSRI
jgi:hypothetical protein